MNKIERTCPAVFAIDKIGRISNYSNKTAIRKELIKLSEKHCAYCNCILRVSEYTPHIEHYRPKQKFPNLEQIWHNLFASCPKCNEYKGNKYPDVKPLKPDTLDYDFDYWFEINWENCKIKPNPLRDKNEQKRAKITIEWLGLNKGSRPTSRKEELDRFNKSSGGDIDRWSYLYLLERR